MRRLTPLWILLVLLASAMLLTACGSATKTPTKPTADERPVPEGTPVMYEFFTNG